MQHSGGFHHRDISTVFNIPISLWVQNETHLFHKNAQTLVDKTGKRLCIKCIVDMFSNNQKSSTYLSKICDDLMMVVKCERGRGVVRFIISELLSNENGFVFKEINKVDDEMLLNNLINLVLTLLNKHFSISENMQRQKVNEHVLSVLIRGINDSNTRMKSMAKLVYVLFDDRLSIYSNSLVDGVVESSENLARFGTIISRTEMENIQYVIPVLVKIMECKPEKVICNLFGDNGLHLSRLLCESSEKKTDFEYMLEFYLHVLNGHPSQFKYLLLEKSQDSSPECNAREELSLNILRGIEKMTIFLAKSSKYSKSKKYHQSRNLNLHQMKDCEPSINHLDCMQDAGSIPSAGNFLSNDSSVKEMEDFGEKRSVWNNLSNMSRSGARVWYGGTESSEIGDLGEEGNILALLRRREKEDEEEGDSELMKNLLIFFKGFMLQKVKMMTTHRRLPGEEWDFEMRSAEEELRSQKQCHASKWLMERESFEIVHKIIEWVIELLRNSIEINLDNLALDCILQIFTREECCCNYEKQADLNSNNPKDANCESEEEELSDSLEKDIFCEHKPKEHITLNIKSLNPKAKRVTFKRNDETPHKKKLIANFNVDKNKLRVSNACMQGGEKLASDAGIEKCESCGELCFHRIFVEKHGQYLLDILLELFDDYLRRFGLNYVRKRSGGSLDMSLYDRGYKYIVDNERQIEEVLQKILNGMSNISGGVAIQSCPRQVYALSWFMDFVINGFLSEESVLRSKPLVPLYGSSSMDVVMNSVDAEQPLENALLSISAKTSQECSPGLQRGGGFVNPMNDYSGQKLVQIVNQIISLIESICRCLCAKGVDRSELEEENAGGGGFYRVDIKKLWKLNGTIYSRDLLLKYFSCILQITQRLCEIKGIRLVQFLESTDKLFEFYSKALKEKEQNIISLSQLYLIQQVFESRQASESEVKEVGCADQLSSHAAFMYDLFSIVLQIDKRVQDSIEESEGAKDQILQRATSKIRQLINNRAGAQLILEWMKNPNIGNQEIYGIKTSVLIRWIVHISRQLLDPIMTESEISSRLKYLNKERIRAALLLDESASSDTISIVISLLTFSHGYFPDQVIQFILRNINREEIRGTDYSEMYDVSEDTKSMQKIQSYGKSSVFGDFGTRNVPARVLFYYSSMLLGNKDSNNGENVYMFRDETGKKGRILSKIISNLVVSSTRRREWLLWHSKDFEKSSTFSDSLHSLIRARGGIGSYQEQKRVEEQVFRWICDRNMDYARYQVVARPFSASCFYPGLVEFSVSPILERSILENVSFIKFEIKQLLSLSSVRVGGASSSEFEVEEFAQSLNMYLSLFIFSIRNYIGRNRSISFDDQLTVEEVTLPLKLFLNINKEDCDFRLKALIGHLTLKFVSAFLVPRCRETNLQEQSCGSIESFSRGFSIERPLRALERFGQSSSRRETSVLLVLVSLVDELTRWVNDTFSTNNMDKFDISTYLETLSSLVLEMGLKGGGFSECVDVGEANFEESEMLQLKARQSLISLIQGDSTRLMLEKTFHYIFGCRKRGNHLDANRPSQLMAVLAMLISMFLSKFQVTMSDDRLERLVDSVLAHPTLLFHVDPSSRCGVSAGLTPDECASHWLACLASSGKSVTPCEGCFRFGLDSSTEEVKLVAITSFIVAMLRPGQSRAASRSGGLTRELFLQGISGILTASIKGSSVSYGYLGIILAIIYLNGDQIMSISLLHNLYVQKFLVKEFVSEVLDFDKGSSPSSCVVFHYSAMLSYLVFVLKVTPWWLNISDLVNLAFINKLGKIYKSLQSSIVLHNENDAVAEYLLGLTEILLKITLETAKNLLNSSNTHFQDYDDNRNSAASLGVIIKLIQDILKNQTNENIQDYNITLVKEHSNTGNGNNFINCISERGNDGKSGCIVCCQWWYRRRPPSEINEKVINNYFIGQVLKFSTMEIFKRIIGN